MKRWIKRGICALTLGAMLTANVLAAELSLSFDKNGTTAEVQLSDVGTNRYAAEVTFSLSGTESVQFQGKADSYAVTVGAGTVTLYAASRTPLAVVNGALDLGTLTVSADAQVGDTASAVVLDQLLNRYTYADAAITIHRGSDVEEPDHGSGSGSGGGSGSGSTVSSTPSVSVNGTGGKVKADSNGNVTITPDSGYRIARILVNGKEVAIADRLTGLKASDVVVVTFEKVPEDTPSGSAGTFTDVQPTDWYADAVEYVVSKNLFQGMSPTEFRPNVEMNRAMLVTVLYRMSGETAQGSSGFTDVADDAWYGPAVAWAKENGIVTGITDTQFFPNRSVTREQMATILCRYAEYQGEVPNADQTVLDDFTDAFSVSEYAVPTLSWAVQEGLLSGVGHQKLSPDGYATRAQVAAILQRFLERNS